MREVLIPSLSAGTLAAQLNGLYETLVDAEPQEQLNFNLKNLEWTCPLLVLPLSAYIKCAQSTFTSPQSNVESYLKTIRFPEGIDSVTIFEQQVQRHKNYIPISVLRKEQGVERERLETMFAQMIVKVIGSTEGTRNAIYYPIGELVTNIFEHSNQDLGFLFGQWYPTKGYLDVCIVDCGRGLAQSYWEAKGVNFTHKEAVIQAMSGTSTKLGVERGFGLRTSKRVVCEALHGGFVLVSGDTALYSVKNKEKLVNLPKFNWQGVIVAYRIPKPKGAVDVSPYLE